MIQQSIELWLYSKPAGSAQDGRSDDMTRSPNSASRIQALCRRAARHHGIKDKRWRGGSAMTANQSHTSSRLSCRLFHRLPCRLSCMENDERGQALVIVLGIIMFVMVITAGLSTNVMQHASITENDLLYHAAYEAAQAGLHQYEYEANQNPLFISCTHDNTSTSGICSPGQNPALFGAVQLDMPTAGLPEYYTYWPTLDRTTGQVNIAVTGIAGGAAHKVARTIMATLNQENFLSHIYLTDYEVLDPALYPLIGDGPARLASRYCQYRANEYNPHTGGYGPDPSTYPYPYGNYSCQFIYFVSGNVLNGPVASNDAFHTCGDPVFNGQVESAGGNGAGFPFVYSNGPGCGGGYPGNPKFMNPSTGNPKQMVHMTFPTANALLEFYAAHGGCLYYGPTTITLNANGTMNVSSPDGGSTIGCIGNNIDLPDNGVIYVANAGGTAYGGGPAPGCTSSNPIPQNGFGYGGAFPSESRCNGDAIIQGTLGYNKQLTVAADTNIIVTGNLCYANQAGNPDCSVPQSSQPGTWGNTVLGLVANQYVYVNHPNKRKCGSSSAPPDCSPYNISIDAGILALNHSFMVANYTAGKPMGTITVYGAIAQKFRGPVGTFGSSSSTGYNKNYNYDYRLFYLSPPHYLNPANQVWHKISFTEIPPCAVTALTCP